MEPITYTNAKHEDVGILYNATLDLEYGNDSSDQANTFEVALDRNADFRLDDGAYIYIEGTEYGGRITGVKSNTSANVVTYKGVTWHGLLNQHLLCPDSGQDYLMLEGDAHEVLRSIVERTGLQSVFTVPYSFSGIDIDYSVRYEYAYFAILSALAASSAKLQMTYQGGMVVLSAEAISDYSQTDELDSTQIDLEIEQSFLPVNHLVCLGEGELKNRLVLHYYADENGNVSTTQTFFGEKENTLKYDYSNADETELSEEGQKKLKELQNCNTIAVNIPDGRTLDIGDLVGGLDPVAGVYAATNVVCKIVNIDEYGTVSVEYRVGDVSASKSMTGRSESSGGGVSYTSGKGITIVGRTISADVDSEDLSEVTNLAQEAKQQASNAAATAATAASTAQLAQSTADGKAPLSHKHTTSDITDFPESMPASDVYTWAKQSEKPVYTYSEVGAAAESHTHDYAGASEPSGAALEAIKFSTPRTIEISGAVNGSASFDGSQDINIVVEGDDAAAGFLAAHPIGSVFESVNSDNPGTLYGGEWDFCPGLEFYRWVRTA